jgi:N-methylhydantoinase A/oxoprolinase/acetone carboxylase beta subunit
MQAAELGIRRLFVPKLAPAFSALGLLLSDHVVDEMRSYVSPVGRADLGRVNALLAEMEAAARRALGRKARLERLAALSAEELSRIGRSLRERVERSHSVDTWAEAIIRLAQR